jgi:hypothetical protein
MTIVNARIRRADVRDHEKELKTAVAPKNAMVETTILTGH